jgi:D-lactate dehydrogenase
LGVNFLPLKTYLGSGHAIAALPTQWAYIHRVNKESIALMKDGVMIINTSRGALINTEDAINGLSGKSIYLRD